MLNVVDSSLLLMFLAGPFCGLGAALTHKAGMHAAIAFTLGGLALSFLSGFASNKLAYSVSGWKRLNEGVGLLVYIAIPLCGLLAVALVPFLVAQIVYGHT